MRDTRTSMPRRRWAGAALVAAVALSACGSDSDDEADSTTTTAAAEGATYRTSAFILPFEVTVPDFLPAEATTDDANFVTWDPGTIEEPAVRFLVPVNVYAPGDTDTTPPPADYLAYLLSQSEHGATFTDQSETTVGGFQATLVTANVADSLDGSLGCQAEDIPAGDCYGLQPDLTLRMAVIDADGTTLLAWLRHNGTEVTEDATAEFAAFETMLSTVTFRDEAPVTTTTVPGVASPIDGIWTTTVTFEELESSPLLYDRDEVNDENWGELTFTFELGQFTFAQENEGASYSSSGTFVVDGDVVELKLDNSEEFAWRWSLEGDTLTFERDEALGISPTPYLINPWTRQG